MKVCMWEFKIFSRLFENDIYKNGNDHNVDIVWKNPKSFGPKISVEGSTTESDSVQAWVKRLILQYIQ